jgi:hypothetical protein
MSRAVAQRLDRLEGKMGGDGGTGQVFVIFPKNGQEAEDAAREQGLNPGPNDHVVGVVFVAARDGEPVLIGQEDRSWLPR